MSRTSSVKASEVRCGTAAKKDENQPQEKNDEEEDESGDAAGVDAADDVESDASISMDASGATVSQQ